MKPRISAWWVLGMFVMLLADTSNSFAHSPFDSSSRVIVHKDSVEVAVTVGSTLGENFLRAAQINPRQLATGQPFPLKPDMAATFFTATADGKILQPREADVITDGLEFQFHFEYALAPTKQLRLESAFLPALPAPRVVPLVLTDENGNMLGSAILSPEKPAADFALPEKLFPAQTNQMLLTSSRQETNALPSLKLPTASQPHTDQASGPSFMEYLKLGIEHILTGYDHLLFLVALLLGCRRLKSMLWIITGFTIAHSLTLALAALNLVTISSRIVEPAIAASIIFVAAENFRRREKSWQRYALTCGFGLIHGFGFAGALRSAGLATSGADLVKPLVGFNLGVEIGQLCVAAVVLPLLFGLRKSPMFDRRGTAVISALVMAVAAFWLWRRVTSLGD